MSTDREPQPIADQIRDDIDNAEADLAFYTDRADHARSTLAAHCARLASYLQATA